eukprot:CAMPEP_0170071076 /NCGR_PEP_ID=MMETSP0019_2-20121128/9148_1 /TAXON_ID=98059 /ORGANISM="Dinobryon sp., Strain UTEXLB2267" /LENGTH=108 /DNA_ID=CAMNT_0010279553 /DNA_START=776 /DNA_END=1102 /DNA_ORIENTATION=-
MAESNGCASAMEDYVVAKITPHVTVLIAVSFLNLFCMIISCCMWWKRKETDIFPEFGAEKLQSLRYSSVKYQFEVMPRRNLLQKEGFIPTEEEEKIDVLRPNESNEEV